MYGIDGHNLKKGASLTRASSYLNDFTSNGLLYLVATVLWMTPGQEAGNS